MQRSVVGRELTISDYVLPLYSFTLTWEVLKDKWDVRMGVLKGPAYSPFGVTPFDELRNIWNFYNQQQGSAIPFNYYDPSDNTTRIDPAVPANFNFAVGDGTTTEFQAASPLLAPVIPSTVISVNLNGTPTGTASLDANTGIFTFSSAPGNGVLIGMDCTLFFYRVRFNTDGLEAENFAYQFWQMKTLKMISKAY